MTATVLVVNTNVVVAGPISSPGDSPVCRLLDGMLAGGFPFLLSSELLQEYRRVLLRGGLRDLHGLSPQQLDVVLTETAANALVREPEPDAELVAPDRTPAIRALRLAATITPRVRMPRPACACPCCGLICLLTDDGDTPSERAHAESKPASTACTKIVIDWAMSIDSPFPLWHKRLSSARATGRAWQPLLCIAASGVP